MGLSKLVQDLKETMKLCAKNQESLLGELRQINGTKSGNHQNYQLSSCGVGFGNGSNANAENGRNDDSGNSAHKVFDQMSMDKFLNNTGTVREYYDRFNVLFGGKGYNEGFLVDLFVSHLRPDIKKGISLFTLNSLSEAYHLAKLQEMVYGITSLSSSSKIDHSKEVTKGSIELGFRDDGKGNVGVKPKNLNKCKITKIPLTQ
ncbi:hypothetical protein Tco_1342554 [Tanacetum coccineum]